MLHTRCCINHKIRQWAISRWFVLGWVFFWGGASCLYELLVLSVPQNNKNKSKNIENNKKSSNINTTKPTDAVTNVTRTASATPTPHTHPPPPKPLYSPSPSPPPQKKSIKRVQLKCFSSCARPLSCSHFHSRVPPLGARQEFTNGALGRQPMSRFGWRRPPLLTLIEFRSLMPTAAPMDVN